MKAEGVNVLLFDNTTRKNCQRSNKIILVKNIPYEITSEQLLTLFSYYGHVTQSILPDTKSIAVIAFESPQHASNAFKNLSYYVYKNEPLYLEWAPESLLQTAEENPLVAVGKEIGKQSKEETD